ncbi:hypothetical protein ACJX0J_022131, partial [Zea mays]
MEQKQDFLHQLIYKRKPFENITFGTRLSLRIVEKILLLTLLLLLDFLLSVIFIETLG